MTCPPPGVGCGGPCSCGEPGGVVRSIWSPFMAVKSTTSGSTGSDFTLVGDSVFISVIKQDGFVKHNNQLDTCFVTC